MFLRCGGETDPFPLETDPFPLEMTGKFLETTGKFLEVDYLSLVLGPPPTRPNEKTLYFILLWSILQVVS